MSQKQEGLGEGGRRVNGEVRSTKTGLRGVNVGGGEKRERLHWRWDE